MGFTGIPSRRLWKRIIVTTKPQGFVALKISPPECVSCSWTHVRQFAAKTLPNCQGLYITLYLETGKPYIERTRLRFFRVFAANPK